MIIWLSQGVITISKNQIKSKIPSAFLIKEIFSAIGLLFILLFTARGIWQITYTFVNHFSDIRAAFTNGGFSENCVAVLGAFKQSQCHALNVALIVVCVLLLFHGIIGVCYAIATDFNFKNMLKQKMWIYLQIISAVGALYVIDSFIRSHAKTSVRLSHPARLCIFVIILAVVGSFHLANGFSNACVTLGISVSNHTKTVVTILSVFIAAISMLQIVILFI